MKQHAPDVRAPSQEAPEAKPAAPIPDGATRPRPAFRRRIAALVLLAVLAVAGFLIWRAFFAMPETPENIVTLSGRIEGDEAAVASKTAGRILEVRFREGDSVAAGATIALVDDEQLRARELQAQAAVTQAQAAENAARAQIGVLQEQLEQARLQTQQARVEGEGRIRQAEAELAAAEADLAQQEATYTLRVFDREAYTKLAKTGAASERQAQEAISAAARQAAAVAAAKRRVEAARGGVTTAKANLQNSAIRAADAARVREQITQQEAQIASAAAAVKQALAQLQEAQASRRDLVITAPFAGIVATRTAEPGEVVAAGTPIVTLLDPAKVYLRGYVPVGEIGKVKIGQAARVYLDSNPNQAIDAYVSRVDPQATFTPENIYFREERVKQVVGVKLQLRGAIGFAKPGMPADGEILVEGETWPEGSRNR